MCYRETVCGYEITGRKSADRRNRNRNRKAYYHMNVEITEFEKSYSFELEPITQLCGQNV